MKKILLSFAIMAGIFCNNAEAQDNEILSQDMPDEYFGYYIYANNLFTFNKRMLDNIDYSSDYELGAFFLNSVLDNTNKEESDKAAESMIEHGGFAIKRDEETFFFKVTAFDTSTKKDLGLSQKDVKQALCIHCMQKN